MLRKLGKFLAQLAVWLAFLVFAFCFLASLGMLVKALFWPIRYGWNWIK